MNEVLEFLKENPIFYIATMDGENPRVRPFGFVMKYNEKLYFCTNNTKEIYKQLNKNPNFEISVTNSEYKWMRLTGKAVFDNNLEAKKKCFVEEPSLLNLYKSDTNPIFEVFYIADGEASFYSMTGEKKIVKL